MATQEEFDAALASILAQLSASDLITIPGVYELVSEEFNNEILAALENEREGEEADEGPTANAAVEEPDPSAPRVFLANDDGTYTCQDCIDPDLDWEEEHGSWLEGSDGWLEGTALTCSTCGKAIPIIANGGPS